MANLDPALFRGVLAARAVCSVHVVRHGRVAARVADARALSRRVPDVGLDAPARTSPPHSVRQTRQPAADRSRIALPTKPGQLRSSSVALACGVRPRLANALPAWRACPARRRRPRSRPGRQTSIISGSVRRSSSGFDSASQRRLGVTSAVTGASGQAPRRRSPLPAPRAERSLATSAAISAGRRRSLAPAIPPSARHSAGTSSLPGRGQRASSPPSASPARSPPQSVRRLRPPLHAITERAQDRSEIFAGRAGQRRHGVDDCEAAAGDRARRLGCRRCLRAKPAPDGSDRPAVREYRRAPRARRIPDNRPCGRGWINLSIGRESRYGRRRQDAANRRGLALGAPSGPARKAALQAHAAPA